MAFVFKSEKGTNKLKNTTRDIGPGEYLPQTDIKLIKLNKEPFLSSVKMVLYLILLTLYLLIMMIIMKIIIMKIILL